MVPPNSCVVFQPFAMMTLMIAATMISNVQIEIRREFLSPDTCIGNSHFSGNATILNINQGDGDPKEISKKFKPTLEETAISPSPY